jgi:hypothetical protein
MPEKATSLCRVVVGGINDLAHKDETLSFVELGVVQRLDGILRLLCGRELYDAEFRNYNRSLAATAKYLYVRHAPTTLHKRH